MARHDLVAHGEAYARAAVFRTALEELLLHVRQLRLGDAVAVVAHANLHILAVGPQRHVDHLPVAPVDHGVVQQVQKYLLEPLRIAGDRGQIHRRGGVVDAHPRLAHELAVGKERVLQLGGDVQRLDAQIEAPVLDARELQKLLDHTGQPLGLLGDDLHAAQGFALHCGVIGDGLGPAGDGGQRGAQLVGDLGDELGAGLLGHGHLLRHVVDLIGQAADLVVIALFELAAVAARGDARGKVGELVDRVRHEAPEPQQQQNHAQAHEHHRRHGQHREAPRDRPDAQQQKRQHRDTGEQELDLESF